MSLFKNHDLEFGGADPHTSHFSLRCEPPHCTVHVLTWGSQQNIICKEQRWNSVIPKLDPLRPLAMARKNQWQSVEPVSLTASQLPLETSLTHYWPHELQLRGGNSLRTPVVPPRGSLGAHGLNPCPSAQFTCGLVGQSPIHPPATWRV